MADWKRNFLERLGQAQSQWLRKFEEGLDRSVAVVFDDLKSFLTHNGFRVSTPLREIGRRSYKFELAENAYVLLIVRSLGVGEFESRCECFVPGSDPSFKKVIVRLADADEAWAREHFQHALDAFLELLAGEKVEARSEADLVPA